VQGAVRPNCGLRLMIIFGVFRENWHFVVKAAGNPREPAPLQSNTR
jgi:hypothetical protein